MFSRSLKTASSIATEKINTSLLRTSLNRFRQWQPNLQELEQVVQATLSLSSTKTLKEKFLIELLTPFSKTHFSVELIDYIKTKPHSYISDLLLIQLHINSKDPQRILTFIENSVIKRDLVSITSSQPDVVRTYLKLINLAGYKFIIRNQLQDATHLFKIHPKHKFSTQVYYYYLAKTIDRADVKAAQYIFNRVILPRKFYVDLESLVRLASIFSVNGYAYKIKQLFYFCSINYKSMSTKQKEKFFIYWIESLPFTSKKNDTIKIFRIVQSQFYPGIEFQVRDLPRLKQLVQEKIRNSSNSMILKWFEENEFNVNMYKLVIASLAELGRGEDAFSLFQILQKTSIKCDNEEVYLYLIRGAFVTRNGGLAKKIISHKHEKHPSPQTSQKFHTLCMRTLLESDEYYYIFNYIETISGDGCIINSDLYEKLKNKCIENNSTAYKKYETGTNATLNTLSQLSLEDKL